MRHWPVSQGAGECGCFLAPLPPKSPDLATPNPPLLPQSHPARHPRYGYARRAPTSRSAAPSLSSAARSGGRRRFRRTVCRRPSCLPSRAPRRRARGRQRAARARRFACAVAVRGSVARAMCTTRAPIVARCARRRGGEPAHERAAELALTRPPATIESIRRAVLGGAWSSAERGPRRCAALAAAAAPRRRVALHSGPHSGPGRYCSAPCAVYGAPRWAGAGRGGRSGSGGAAAGAAAAARRRWVRRMGAVTEVPTLRAFGALAFDDVTRRITTRSRCCWPPRHMRPRTRAPSPPRSRRRLTFGRCRSD